jgi:membrane-associated phospholipid phosphatase
MHFLGVPWQYLVIFHVLVCLGRVYFMCHWVLDTVVSTILGTGIAKIIIYLKIIGFFKPILNLYQDISL